MLGPATTTAVDLFAIVGIGPVLTVHSTFVSTAIMSQSRRLFAAVAVTRKSARVV